MTSATDVQGPPKSPLAFIAGRARPYCGLFVATLAAAALGGVLGLAPLMAISAVVAIAHTGDADLSRVLIIALAGAAGTLLHLLMAVLATLGGHKTAFALQRDLRLDIVRRIVRAPVSRVEGRAGEIKKTVLGDVDRLEGLLAHVLPDIAAGLAATIAGGLVLAFVDWRIFLASIVLLPAAAGAQLWMYGGRPELFERWNRVEADANAALLSYVRGIATLRAFNRQASTLENVRGAVHELRDLAVLITRKSRYSYSLFNSLLSTNLVVVLPVALLLSASGEIDAGAFVLSVTLGATLIAPLHKVVFATMIASRTAVAVGRIEALLATGMLPDEASTPLPRSNVLKLEGVSFAYPGGTPVLRDIDLEIPENSVIAIVGPSGAGKSTLARLLLRMEDPTAGRIMLGGVDMRDMPVASLRRRLAAVFQDSLLFHGSIAENLALADPSTDDGHRHRALADAGADTIAADGGATLALGIGDRGQRLSGGEKQRVAIARALVKNAPVVLLDEATAFVDAISETLIQRSFARVAAGRTLIIIAHRLSSVRNVDRIVVLNDGAVEASGSHQALLATSPTYRRLQNAQEKAARWSLGANRRGGTR